MIIANYLSVANDVKKGSVYVNSVKKENGVAGLTEMMIPIYGEVTLRCVVVLPIKRKFEHDFDELLV